MVNLQGKPANVQDLMFQTVQFKSSFLAPPQKNNSPTSSFPNLNFYKSVDPFHATKKIIPKHSPNFISHQQTKLEKGNFEF